MYRDLDASLWPKSASIVDQPLIRSLLADGFEATEELVPDDGAIDPFIGPSNLLHIVDSDSSQTLAVHEVRRGRNLVIQGPPGTGKSQTIANIVASAIADGKTVLFLAEKMAALEVVKRRLDATGVGDACLALHSNKANKRALLEELKRTWHLGSPKSQAANPLNQRLLEARDTLNTHATRLHQPSGAASLTPYQVIGQLTRLKQDGRAPNDIALEGSESWTADDLANRQEILAELAERVSDIGTPAEHVWSGIGLTLVLPADVDRLAVRIDAAAAELEEICQLYLGLAEALALEPPTRLEDLEGMWTLADRVASAPLSGNALRDAVWADKSDEIDALLKSGEDYDQLVAELAPHLKAHAFEAEVASARAALTHLPETLPVSAFERIAKLHAALPLLIDATARLNHAMGQGDANTLVDVERSVEIGERVAAAPEASPQAFLASLWESGVERAGDLAAAVLTLEGARAEIGNALNEAAWDIDLVGARATLAMHGTSLLRWFNGEWRRSNRLVRSFLVNPSAPVGEVLPVLDTLARGQTARQTIRDNDDLGQAAFDQDWRGEKSRAQPLQLLVNWMRSLRGLGSEPRLIASRGPARGEIGALAKQARTLMATVRGLMYELFADLRDQPEQLFDNDEGLERTILGTVLTKAAVLDKAWGSVEAVFSDIPAAIADTRARLAQLVDAQAAARHLKGSDALGTSAFADDWQGTNSEWSTLRAAADWVNSNADIRLLSASMIDRAEPASRAQAADARRMVFLAMLSNLLGDLVADLETVFGQGTLDGLAIEAIAARLEAWRLQRESLSKWVTYRDRAAKTGALGLGAVVDLLHDGSLAPADATPNFEMSYYEAVFAEQARAAPELAWFDGDLHSRRVREFADLDRQRIAASSYEVVRAHHRTIPPTSGGAAGPLGILRSEIQRKRPAFVPLHAKEWLLAV